MQGKLADIYCKLQSSRSFVYACANSLDNGHISNADAAACFLFSSENATQVALQGIQALGGNG